MVKQCQAVIAGCPWENVQMGSSKNHWITGINPSLGRVACERAERQAGNEKRAHPDYRCLRARFRPARVRIGGFVFGAGYSRFSGAFPYYSYFPYAYYRPWFHDAFYYPYY